MLDRKERGSVTPYPLAPIEESDFTATGQFEDTRLSMRLWGHADMRVKARLDVFLEEADNQSVAGGIKEVVVDFRELVFMNSSCLKALVTWLGRVQDRPAEQRYAIRFLKEPAAHWQKRSFNALCAFAGDVLTIQ
jgi:hypothetical protein